MNMTIRMKTSTARMMTIVFKEKKIMAEITDEPRQEWLEKLKDDFLAHCLEDAPKNCEQTKRLCLKR